MDILYTDEDIVVCIKPPRVLSTDEPGGMPELLRQEFGTPDGDIRTVHRLDRVVSGLMVFARSAQAASNLSQQIREQTFQKEYLAMIHGRPETETGILRDLLLRDKRERKTYIVAEPAKGVQEAILSYRVESCLQEMTRVRIWLHTGRTHQIRAQFSGRGMPLVGDKKYSLLEDPCEIALWSCRLVFNHPRTGKPMEFSADPPAVYPWIL